MFLLTKTHLIFRSVQLTRHHTRTFRDLWFMLLTHISTTLSVSPFGNMYQTKKSRKSHTYISKNISSWRQKHNKYKYRSIMTLISRGYFIKTSVCKFTHRQWHMYHRYRHICISLGGFVTWITKLLYCWCTKIWMHILAQRCVQLVHSSLYRVRSFYLRRLRRGGAYQRTCVYIC